MIFCDKINLIHEEEIIMPADLHCHTKLSDGSVSIEELIALGKGAGLTAIAVTDHDTLAGAMRGKMLGERSGIQVIPGAEFSCRDEQGNNVHLLCYLPEYPDRLQGLCKEINTARKEAGLKMAAMVMKQYSLPKSMIQKWINGSTNLFKQHIMLALQDAGYTTTVFGPLYDQLFGENGWAKVKITYPRVEDVLSAIHQAEGLAVLAHPYHYNNVDLIPALKEQGLDGVEVWHHSADAQQQAHLLDLVREYDLLATGGSDFHGANCSFPNPVGSHTMEDGFLNALLAAKTRKRIVAAGGKKIPVKK